MAACQFIWNSILLGFFVGIHYVQGTFLGSDPTLRPYKDSWSNAVFIPNPAKSIHIPGHLVEWSFYSIQDVPFYAQMWRALDKSNYTLVGQTYFPSPGQGFTRLTLEEEEKIEVNAGDVIGFAFPRGNPLPFNADLCTKQKYTGLYLKDTAHLGLDSIEEFTQMEIHWKPCREYSLEARIKPDYDLIGAENRDDGPEGPPEEAPMARKIGIISISILGAVVALMVISDIPKMVRDFRYMLIDNLRFGCIGKHVKCNSSKVGSSNSEADFAVRCEDTKNKSKEGDKLPLVSLTSPRVEASSSKSSDSGETSKSVDKEMKEGSTSTMSSILSSETGQTDLSASQNQGSPSTRPLLGNKKSGNSDSGSPKSGDTRSGTTRSENARSGNTRSGNTRSGKHTRSATTPSSVSLKGVSASGNTEARRSPSPLSRSLSPFGCGQNTGANLPEYYKRKQSVSRERSVSPMPSEKTSDSLIVPMSDSDLCGHK